MKKIIFIVGNSGAGKTTYAEELAKKYDFALLGEDNFVFKMNPGSMVKRVSRGNDRKIGMKNLNSVLENYIIEGISIVIEGAFVDGPLYLDDFLKIARKNNYDFCPIMLVVDRRKSIRRKKKKGYVVPEVIDRRLREAALKLEYPEKCYVFDTGKQSLKKGLKEIEKIAGLTEA